MKFLTVLAAVLALFGSAAASPPYEEISSLIQQHKTKDARNLIDEQMGSAGGDGAALFKLQALRTESFIAEDNLSLVSSEFEKTAKAFGKLSASPRTENLPAWAALRDRMSKLASANFFKAISLDASDKSYDAYRQWARTGEKLKQAMDDRSGLTGDIAFARICLSVADNKRAIRLLKDDVEKIPDLIRKYSASLKEDEYLSKSFQWAFVSLMTAHFREGDVKNAERVKLQWFSMIDEKARGVYDAWFDSEVAKLQVRSKLEKVILPLLKKTMDAVSSDNPYGLQSLMLPASAQYASIPAILKKTQYRITDWKIIEIFGNPNPQPGARVMVKVYVAKDIVSRHDLEKIDNIRPDQVEGAANLDDLIQGLNLHAYSNWGPEKVYFQHDGADWKLDRYDFDEIHYYPSANGSSPGVVIR